MASVDTYKEGEAIVAAKGVMLELAHPLKVAGKVLSSGGAVQHAQLASTPQGLHWSCTCGSSDFCAHLVAVALVAGQDIPQHHQNPKSTGGQ